MIKPQPDEEQIVFIRKILKNYSDKISAIKIEPPSKSDILSEQIACFERKMNEMNSKINKEKEIFRKIRGKIETDIANLPSKCAVLPDITPKDKFKPTENVNDKPPHFVQPDIPSVTGPGIDRGTPSPLPGHPFQNSQTSGQPLKRFPLPIAIHLLSGSGPAPADEKIAVHHSRFWRVVGLIGIFIGACGLGIWLYINFIKSVHKVFPLSYNQTAGLAVKNMSIFSIDPQRHLLFTMVREDGRVKSVQKFPNQYLSGLAAGDDSLWSTDTSRIYQHNMDSGYTIRRTFSNPNQNPAAIYWDGGFLWIGDSRSATVYKYAIKEDSLVLVKQYALEGIVPAGFYMSDNLLWVFDATASKIIRYRVETTLNPADSMNMNSLMPAGSKITGFTVDGSDLWLVTENPAELHRFDMRRLTRAFRAGAAGK